MADPSEGGGSLKEGFKRFNHVRHILMDISMIGMAVASIIATGGVFGFFDPIAAWAKMHVSGIPDLLTSGPEFLSEAFNQAGNGVFFTGAEADMHAMHGASMGGGDHAIASVNHSMHHDGYSLPASSTAQDHTGHVMGGAVDLTDKFTTWVNALPPDELSGVAQEAADWGMSLSEYYETALNHH